MQAGRTHTNGNFRKIAFNCADYDLTRIIDPLSYLIAKSLNKVV